MSGPRVHDGDQWIDVKDASTTLEGSPQGPVPPVMDGDGRIFVSFPSFRDGKRCAATIRSIFDNAKNPDKVTVGLIEQSSEEEPFCLSEYCNFYGVKNNRGERIRKDMTKIIVQEERTKCPRFDQIRRVAVHHIAAKGPSEARSLTRKILGNEEFCLQTDAHMVFAKDWDEMAKEEWKNAANEFAIISTVPANKDEQSEYESWTGSKRGEVPRGCIAKMLGNNIPEFDSPADGKAVNLQKPLLAHTWSAANSFSKCHLEEAAPYDPFTPYILGPEQFARFARFWTRGYDVYTPTRNIVYHDYSTPDGHDQKEWFKQRKERLRKLSVERIQSFLQAPGIDFSETSLANLGIYGLGKRRTLQQLADFVGVDIAKNVGNRKHKQCANQEWVPYDTSISPMENMYQNANDLDPQPEFPLRTELTFYEKIEEPADLDISIGHMPKPEAKPIDEGTHDPPMLTLFSLWIFGLVVWCILFVNHGGGVQKRKPRSNRRGASGYKDI